MACSTAQPALVIMPTSGMADEGNKSMWLFVRKSDGTAICVSKNRQLKIIFQSPNDLHLFG